MVHYLEEKSTVPSPGLFTPGLFTPDVRSPHDNELSSGRKSQIAPERAARLRKTSIDVSRVRLNLRQRRIAQVSRRLPRFKKVDIAATCQSTNNAHRPAATPHQPTLTISAAASHEVDRPEKQFPEIAREILGKEGLPLSYDAKITGIHDDCGRFMATTGGRDQVMPSAGSGRPGKGRRGHPAAWAGSEYSRSANATATKGRGISRLGADFSTQTRLRSSLKS